MEDGTLPKPDYQPHYLTRLSVILLESLSLWLLKNRLLHNGCFIFPIKIELAFYFFFEYANTGFLPKFHLIYHSVKSRLPWLAHYFSRTAFPHYEMLPGEATFLGLRIQVEDKAIVFLEQIKFSSI